MPLAKDVVVTGLPRAGLTLACALLDQLPDSVCLNAPEWHLSVARKLAAVMPMSKWLVGDFAWHRQELLAGHPVPDLRRADGLPFTDGQHGKSTVQITKPGLTPDFILGMKHHVLYSAILPQLVAFNRFTVIAVIRHPIEVIGSWQKLAEPFIAEGNPAGIAHMWPEALAIATCQDSPLDKLSQLYELFAARYYALRDKIHIVKYEDLLDAPMTLSRLFNYDKPSGGYALVEQPAQQRHMQSSDAIRASLKKYAAATKFFYPDL